MRPGGSTQTDDRPAGHGLARAGFADQAKHLAAADREAHVVDRLDDAVAQEEMGSSPETASTGGAIDGHLRSRGFITSRS